jgi:hypothetical protein
MFNRLLLISQLHRSGGTLFSQLLDGHSHIQAHPHELFIGRPKKWNWPTLEDCLDSPELVFNNLQEHKIAAIGKKGVFVKPGSNPEAAQQSVPFSYDLDRHRQSFCELYQKAPVRTRRFAIQLYFETFFLAWPEYRASGHERYVSCFLPHLILYPESLRRLFGDFPDVFLVSVLRRPDAWLASLVNHISLPLSDTAAVTQHLERWRASVNTILALHRNPALYTFTTTYESLVSNLRDELTRFCGVAGIPFEPVLLTPTVGGHPVLPNSSYTRHQHGVNRSSLRPSLAMPDSVASLLHDTYRPLYDSVCTMVGIPSASTPDNL